MDKTIMKQIATLSRGGVDLYDIDTVCGSALALGFCELATFVTMQLPRYLCVLDMILKEQLCHE